MKKVILFILIIIGFIQNLKAQNELLFETSILPQLNVSFSPTVNFYVDDEYIDPNNCTYYWTFGDGEHSTDQHPIHPYAEYDSYIIHLTVSYYHPGSVRDLNPEYISKTVTQWVTLLPDYSFPQDFGLEPVINKPTTVLEANQDFSISCSINPNLAGTDYIWELIINDEPSTQIEISSTTQTYFTNIKKPAGIYLLKLRVSQANNPKIWAESKIVTIQVNNMSGAIECGQSPCMISEIWTSTRKFKEGSSINCQFGLRIGRISSNNPDWRWICESINNTADIMHWKHDWEIVSTSTPLGASEDLDYNAGNGSETFYIDRSLGTLPAGEYTIGCKVSPTYIDCNKRSTYAYTTIEVIPDFSLNKNGENKNIVPIISNQQYELKMPMDGGAEKIKISDIENCNGTILVDGDWISIDKFTNKELVISCNESGDEEKNGRIIVTFPGTFESKIIYVNQPQKTHYVSNSLSLAMAADNAEDGAIIILDEGVYNTPVNIRGKNITLASKFITTGDANYIDNTVIDASGIGSVVRIEGDGSFVGTTKIIGMHLKGGNAEKGGGIYCSHANLELEHVLIHNSFGGKGGGIYASNAIINANHITTTDNDSEIETQNAWSTRKFGNLIYLKNGAKINVLNSIIGTKETDFYEGGIYYEPWPVLTAPPCEMHISRSRVEGNMPWLDLTRCYILYIANGNGSYYYFDDNPYLSLHKTKFEDPENQNYWLSSNSFYNNKGTDEKDIGALFRTNDCINCDVISVNPQSIDYDNVILGESVTKVIEITNLIDYKINATVKLGLYEDDINHTTPYSTVPLDIDDFSVVPDKLNFERGETKKIYVTFNPQSFGSKRGRIDIDTKSQLEVTEIQLNGNCVTKPDLLGETNDNVVEINSGRYLWGNGFSYTIRNNGGTPSGTCKVKYYLSNNSVSTTNATFLGEQQIPPLQAGESIFPLQFNSISIPQTTYTDDYFILAIVDSENEIDEHNEENNLLAKAIHVTNTYPALTVTDVKVLDPAYEFTELERPGGRPGDAFKINFKVNNSSDESLEYNLKVYLSEDGVYDASDVEVGALLNKWIVSSSNGRASWGYVTINIPEGSKAGGYNLLFRAVEVSIPEDNYSINTTVQPFEIFSLPDYEIFWSQESNYPLFAGENYFTSISLMNRGNSNAPSIDINYYLSSDPNYDINDIELGTTTTKEFTLDKYWQQLEKVVTIPKTTAPGEWYILSVADPTNQVEETDETNNAYYVTVQVENHPDLLMLPIDLSGNNVMAGAYVNVSCSVSNIDYGVAPESKLKFYLSENELLDNSWDPLLAEVTVPSLAKDEVFNVTSLELPIPFETGGGNWYVYAKIDGEISCPNSWCDIKETNEDNNIVNAPISVWRQPDLSFGNMHVTVDNATVQLLLEGSEINLAYEVWHTNGNMNNIGLNKGLSHTENHTLKCYLSNDLTLATETDVQLSSILLPGSEGNTRLEGDLPITIPGNLDAGQWYLIAVADVNNDVEERDETNNTWIQEITIAKKPDLALNNFEASPNILVENITKSVYVTGNLENLVANTTVQSPYVHAYFSYNDILDNNDILMHSLAVGSDGDPFPRSYNSYFTLGYLDIPDNLPHGTYYLIYEVTSYSSENDFNNNTLILPIEVEQPVDLEISNISIDKTIQEGSDFTVSCTVKNNNTKTSEPCQLNLFLDVGSAANYPNSNFMINLEDIQLSGISGGDEVVISRTYTMPIQPNINYFNAVCDYNESNLEFDKDNNSMSVPIELYPDIPPLEITSTSITNVKTISGKGGAAFVNMDGGLEPYSYLWEKDGATYSNSSSLWDVNAGIYQLTVTDYAGNTIQEMIEINEPNILEATISIVNHESSTGAADGTVEVTLLNGNPPYKIHCIGSSYSEVWPVGQNTGIIDGLIQGTYTVIIEDASTPNNPIINSLYLEAKINSPLVVNLSYQNVSAYGASDGSISVVHVSNGFPPYSFNWQKDDSDYSTQENLTNLSVGLYSLTITDSEQNTFIKDFYISEPDQLVVEYDVTDVSSKGTRDGAIDLNIISGTPPYRFVWGKFDSGQFGLKYDEDISELSPGTYWVNINSGDNGQYLSYEINIQSLELDLEVSNVKTNGGTDGAVEVETLYGIAPFTFEWLKDGAFFSNSQSISNIEIGTYEISATDKYGLTTTEEIAVTEPDIWLMNYSKNDVTTYNGNDGSIDISVSGGNAPYSYTWRKSGSGVNLSHAEDIYNLSAGVYEVIINDFYGLEMTQSIEIKNQLFASGTRTNNTIIGGEAGTINIVSYGGYPTTDLMIFKDGVQIETYSNLVDEQEVTVNNLASGEYFALYTDSKGNTANITFHITDPLVINRTITPLNSFESNDASIKIEVSGGLPPYSYIWKKNDNFYSNEKNLSNLAPGMYDLTVLDSDSRSITISQNILEHIPTAEISGGGGICNDGSEAVINLHLTGSSPWRIVLDNDNTENYIYINNITSEYFEYRTSIPGTYTIVQAFDSRLIRCTLLPSSATVEQLTQPTATISGGGTLCQNAEGVTVSIDLTGEAPWNITYTNGSLIYQLTDITESHYEFTTDIAGSYTVTSVSDANCTGSASGIAEVIVQEVPVAYTSGGEGICNNQGSALINIVLSGTAPWDITYNDGTNSHIVNGITDPLYEIITDVTGPYSVTEISDATGCPGYSINTLEVENHQLPTANISGGGAICENTQANLNFSLTGTAPWTITYTDGTTSSEINAWINDFTIPGSAEGTYQVTALSDNFCTGTDFGESAEIIIVSSPVVNLGQDASICEGNTLTLDAGSGYQSYSWNGQPGSSQLEVSTAGTYTIEVTDNNGCKASDEIEVITNPLPLVDLGPDITASSDAFIYLTAELGYQSYEWSGNNTCRVLCVSMQNVSTSAEVWLNVTDENGCIGTDNVILTLANLPQTQSSEESADGIVISNFVLKDLSVNEEPNTEEEGIKPVTYKLFPNPTDGKLSILISDPSRVKSIKVYSLQGDLVKSFDYILNNRIELDLTNYSKGTYLIKIVELEEEKEFKIIRN